MCAATGLHLDVRHEVARREDPFEKIMRAAARLKPGQSLTVINEFEPRLLYKALLHGGFAYVADPHAGGGWRITIWRPDIR